MKNIPKILIKTYLRRQPIHLRLSRFNFLTRYSWLKNLLEDLKPEFFPPEKADDSAIPVVDLTEEPSAAALLRIRAQLQGRRGLYEVTAWTRRRGNGHLFQGMQLSSKQPVVIKEFLLPVQLFSGEEIRARQQAFRNLGGFQYPDEREREIRIIRPLEAIVDEGIDDERSGEKAAFKRFYLISDRRDACITLREKMREQKALSPGSVRSLLAQLLQTLAVLHQQKVLFPSGQIQSGLVHGNLSADSVLWVEEKGVPFLYLSDFALWEHLFQRPYETGLAKNGLASMVGPESVTAELAAVGQLGYGLLTGQLDQTVTGTDEFEASVVAATGDEPRDLLLEAFICRLLGMGDIQFESAEAAWHFLLALPQPLVPKPPQRLDMSAPKPVRKRRLPTRSLLTGVGVAGLALIGGLVWLATRGRSEARTMASAPLCCLQEVGAIPAGSFTYATVAGGTWDYVVGQQNVGAKGQSLGGAIAPIFANSNTVLRSAAMRVDTPVDAIAAVQSGVVDFAILPLVSSEKEPVELPLGLAWETIAYDGIAAVVSFSYAERKRSLPHALDGKISLGDLQQMYTGVAKDWRSLSRIGLPVITYSAAVPEIAVFEQKVLGVSPDKLALAYAPDFSERLPTLSMLREIIRDFEGVPQVGGIGLAPLSQVVGQCSVYPLAVSEPGERAVQPWLLEAGVPIKPTTDLCDRKGQYQPDIAAFQSGDYPLAYSVVVVYPQDNSRLPIGQKFAELMQTDEGQYLLSEAGLVPLRPVKTLLGGEP